MKQVTLLFLRKDNKLLLAMKKRGFGRGLWNGVGGKVEPGETIFQAANRECLEEIGVTPVGAMRVGHIRFFMPDDPAFEHDCHVFVTDKWKGEPGESEEMRPQWFDITAIPYSEMWPDDSVWMPHLIAGELFDGTVTTSEDELVSHTVTIIPKV